MQVKQLVDVPSSLSSCTFIGGSILLVGVEIMLGTYLGLGRMGLNSLPNVTGDCLGWEEIV